jgi:ketosteroid isomerase-like protein
MQRSNHTRFSLSAMLCLLAIGVVGCNQADYDTAQATAQEAEPMIDQAAEAAAIKALETEWSDRFGAADVDGIMAMHAQNVVQLPPGSPALVGQEAVRASWEGMANTEGLSASWESTAAYVAPSGEMAFDYGIANVTLPDGTSEVSNYLVVWVREDGEWKVAADMWNPAEAPATE